MVNTCNQHDRHSGSGYETAPIQVPVQDSDSEDEASSMQYPLLAQYAQLRFFTLNLNLRCPGDSFWDHLSHADVVCLQEVTPYAYQEILAGAAARGFSMRSALEPGQGIIVKGNEV